MGWIKETRRSLTKNWEFRRRQKPGKPVRAAVRWEDDRCITTVGDREFFIRSEAIKSKDVQVYDFLIFPLTVLSAQFHLRIEMDFPISESAAQRLPLLRMFIDGWCMARMATPDLTPLEVVANPERAQGGGLLCMSGGFDSTTAALEARGTDFTHGLLFAGADYFSADAPAFRALRDRVEEIARRLGFQLIVIETDLRKLHIDWELFHGWVLAMGLHFHASRFSKGGVGLDWPIYHDHIIQPWGGSEGLYSACSLMHFEISSFNRLITREEKAAKIARSEFDLLPLISTCIASQDSSNNCGVCWKCLNARIRVMAAGYDLGLYCDQAPDILSVYPDGLDKDHRGLRLSLLGTLPLIECVEPGPLRDHLQRYVDQIRAKLVRLSPRR